MDMTIQIDRRGSQPRYLQIAQSLRSRITDGTMPAGARLPSTRDLAAQLAVARGTVDAAYAVLAGEGAIEARGGSGGTVVSPLLTTALSAPGQPSLLLDLSPPAQPATPLPFRLGLPALDAFPRKSWSALTVRAARALGPADMAYPDPAGFIGLRRAIAAYLGMSRGIQCDADQVIITQGYQGGLALVRDVLLRPGDAVWIEDPGYTMTRQSLEAAGARLVPVRVDQHGLRVAGGISAAPRARLAVVTPGHQSPLGVSLSLPRRLALLAWATEANAWVLEDDYDGEFRYSGKPLPALKSLDQGQRVIHGGSFSKVLHPGLRLGYLVPPRELLDAFLRASRLRSGGLPVLEQRVAATFLDRGLFARHLRRMRALYAARRAALSASLIAVFGDSATIDLAAGGMHLIVRFPGAADDTVLTHRAAEAGLAATALSSLAIAHGSGQGLVLGFTNIAEADAPAMAVRLAAALGVQAAS